MSIDTAARIAELATRYSLSSEAESALATLVGLVLSDPAASTAVRGVDRVLDEHIADSLVALDVEEVQRASSIADLGSGSGFPGLPLAIARTDALIALVESGERKARFLNRAAAECGLRNVRVVNSRLESWEEGADRCDLVTARALAPLPVVLEYGAPLLHVRGSLLVWRGARDRDAESAAARAADELGLEAREPLLVRPFQAARRRHLHLFSKVRPTPPRFPRRPGVAAKRPLGGRPQAGAV